MKGKVATKNSQTKQQQKLARQSATEKGKVQIKMQKSKNTHQRELGTGT